MGIWSVKYLAKMDKSLQIILARHIYMLVVIAFISVVYLPQKRASMFKNNCNALPLKMPITQ